MSLQYPVIASIHQLILGVIFIFSLYVGSAAEVRTHSSSLWNSEETMVDSQKRLTWPFCFIDSCTTGSQESESKCGILLIHMYHSNSATSGEQNQSKSLKKRGRALPSAIALEANKRGVLFSLLLQLKFRYPRSHLEGFGCPTGPFQEGCICVHSSA